MNYNLQVDLKILFRYGTIYREVVTMPKIDFCDATKKHHTNQPLANRLTSVFMTYIKASYPREVHECPYYVCILVFNLK